MKKTLLLTDSLIIAEDLKHLKSNNIKILKLEDIESIENLNIDNVDNIIIDRRNRMKSKDIAILSKRAKLNNINFTILFLMLDYEEMLTEILKSIIKPLNEFKGTDRAIKFYNMIIDRATSRNEKIVSTNFLLLELYGNID